MKYFYKIVRRLSERFPTEYPIYIYFTTKEILPNCWGDCSFTGKSYSVRIVKTNWDTALFIYLHELCHILTWSKCNNPKSYHDDEFGRMYAKVWRVYSGEE